MSSNDGSGFIIVPKKKDTRDNRLLYFSNLEKLTINNCTGLKKIMLNAKRLGIISIDEDSKIGLEAVEIVSIIPFDSLATIFPTFFDLKNADAKHEYFCKRVEFLKLNILDARLSYNKYEQRLADIRNLISIDFYEQEKINIENIFLVCAHIQVINNFLKRRADSTKDDGKIINFEYRIFALIRFELELLGDLENEIKQNRQAELNLGQEKIVKLILYLFNIKTSLFQQDFLEESKNLRLHLYKTFQYIFDLQTNIRLADPGNPKLRDLNEKLEKLKADIFNFKSVQDLRNFLLKIKDVVPRLSDDLDYWEFMVEKGILFLENSASKINHDEYDNAKLELNLFKKLLQAKQSNDFNSVFDKIKALLTDINASFNVEEDLQRSEEKLKKHQPIMCIIGLHISFLSQESVILNNKDKRLAEINGELEKYRDAAKTIDGKITTVKEQTFTEVDLGKAPSANPKKPSTGNDPRTHK